MISDIIFDSLQTAVVLHLNEEPGVPLFWAIL